MKNRENGVPNSKALAKRPMFNKFPVGRPIFWGPGQLTKFPDQYAEPDPGFRLKSPVIVPRIVRFLFGQSSNVNISRTIHLGRSKLLYSQWIDDLCPNVSGGHDFYRREDFETITEIATEYDANMSSKDLVSLKTYTDAVNTGVAVLHEDPDIFGIFLVNPIFWMEFLSFGHVPNHTFTCFNTPDVVGNAYLEFVRTVGPVRVDVGASSDANYLAIAATKTNGDGLFGTVLRDGWQHYLLENIIIGSNQFNFLGFCITTSPTFDVDNPPLRTVIIHVNVEEVILQP